MSIKNAWYGKWQRDDNPQWHNEYPEPSFDYTKSDKERADAINASYPCKTYCDPSVIEKGES